jgi:hypothetical protein
MSAGIVSRNWGDLNNFGAMRRRAAPGFRGGRRGVSWLAMSRRLFLPTAPSTTVDAVRKQLGGRASTDAGAGEVVSFRDERGGERMGVVLFVRGDDLDVWVEGDLVRRVRRADTQAADGVVSRALLAVARDAQGFATLQEGQRVRYQHPGGLGDGALVEKCRFGGLVEREDRKVLGIGFRRLLGA